jgi:hypothetical protein
MTVTLSYAGGTAAFDTGTRNLSWNGQAYAFNGNASFGLPMNVSYSLVTGGQTYTGSVLHTVGFTFNGGSEIDTSGYPASIVLVPDAGVGLNLFQSLGANATAANGFRMELVAVPEPSTIALGVLSVVGCFCFRRARKTGTGR